MRPSARVENWKLWSLLELLSGRDGALNVQRMGRGYAWLDTGTHGSLLDAGNFVRTLEKRQGQQAGCLEEIAFSMGWINADQLHDRAMALKKNDYGVYLLGLLHDRAMPRS